MDITQTVVRAELTVEDIKVAFEKNGEKLTEQVLRRIFDDEDVCFAMTAGGVAEIIKKFIGGSKNDKSKN